MRPIPDNLRGTRVTVLGLGHFGGGIAVTRWLASNGAKVTVVDDKPAEALADGVAAVADLDVTLALGSMAGVGGEEVFTRADLVVASPAVPPTHAGLRLAESHGVPVTTEIALVIARLPTRLVFGVTGTKGKSTTAALLSKMLGAWQPLPPDKADRVRGTRSPLVDLAGGPRRTWLGGNIGGSLLADLPSITPADFVVLELSSYMLHHLARTGGSPHVALYTKVGVDHLAWHGSAEAYHAAKGRLAAGQREEDFVLFGASDPVARRLAGASPGTKIAYGRRGDLPEALAPNLPGKHNRFNERGAVAAARLAGVYVDQAAAAVADFAGLPHRLQLVHTDARGVRWVDDSIATIPEAAAAAARAFAAGRVVQIVGGSDKGLPLEAMAEVLRERCKAILTVGQMGPAVARLVGDLVTECGDIPSAVEVARTIVAEGDVVLLSPGFASYDQFPDFEARGRAFTQAARGE